MTSTITPTVFLEEIALIYTIVAQKHFVHSIDDHVMTCLLLESAQLDIRFVIIGNDSMMHHPIMN